MSERESAGVSESVSESVSECKGVSDRSLFVEY